MYLDKTFLAVVTARAGSVGVPGKNYKIFMGKPLVYWSILAAYETQEIDHVYISSNCPYVEQISNEFIESSKDGRVSFVLRPDHMSGPKSKNEEALSHSAFHYLDKFYSLPDFVINLQPTSPIRRKDLIGNAIKNISEENRTSLMTVSKHTPFFVQSTDIGNKWYFDIYDRKMRQDIPESDFFYHDDGCLYITNTEHLVKTGCRLSYDAFLLENDRYSSLQIDTEDDFVILENIRKCIGDSYY